MEFEIEFLISLKLGFFFGTKKIRVPKNGGQKISEQKIYSLKHAGLEKFWCKFFLKPKTVELKF